MHNNRIRQPFFLPTVIGAERGVIGIVSHADEGKELAATGKFESPSRVCCGLPFYQFASFVLIGKTLVDFRPTNRSTISQEDALLWRCDGSHVWPGDAGLKGRRQKCDGKKSCAEEPPANVRPGKVPWENMRKTLQRESIAWVNIEDMDHYDA